MRQKGAMIFWGVVIVIGIIVASFFGIRSIIRANTVAPFKNDLNAYLKLGAAGPARPPGPVATVVTGKNRGKIIPVDVKDNAIDYVYFDLPDELRPAKPDEVATVALVSWGKVEYGKYSNGSIAYRQDCNVRVFDKATGAEIAATYLEGEPPPQRKKNSRIGDRPQTGNPGGEFPQRTAPAVSCACLIILSAPCRRSMKSWRVRRCSGPNTHGNLSSRPFARSWTTCAAGFGKVIHSTARSRPRRWPVRCSSSCGARIGRVCGA